MKRLITDKAIVISKIYKEATEDREFKDFKTGETVRLKATPESFSIVVLSAQKIHELDGMVDPQLQKAYEVDVETYNRVNYLDECEVDFEWNGNTTKVVEVRF